MKRTLAYHTLFELLRQGNLSTLSVSPRQLGLSDAVQPEIAAELLTRANNSWAHPALPGD